MNIFIASTYYDLKAYRDAASLVVSNSGHRAELVERLAGVQAEGVAQLLRSMVRTCHGCVLIVGSRRGSGPDLKDATSDSYTMIEFHEAVTANMPIKPFFINSEEGRNFLDGEWVSRFRSLVSEYEAPDSIVSFDDFRLKLKEWLTTLDKQVTINPSEREVRVFDYAQARQLMRHLGEDFFENVMKADAGDMLTQRTRSQLQGYPLGEKSENFKEADELNDIGWSCHEQQQYSTAKIHYKNALDVCPNFPLVWNNKGLTHFRLSELEDARQCYFNAIQIAPGYTTAWSNLAKLYWNGLKDGDAAKTWAERALAIDPDFLDAKMLKKSIELVERLEGENLTDADARMVKLFREHNDEVIVYMHPGVEAMKQEKYALAIPHFEKAISTAPEIAEFHNFSAICSCYLGNFNEAEKKAREAVELDPEYAAAWLNLSWAQERLGLLDEGCRSAILAFAYGSDPDIIDQALDNMVAILCRQKKFREAWAAIETQGENYSKPDKIEAAHRFLRQEIRAHSDISNKNQPE